MRRAVCDITCTCTIERRQFKRELSSSTPISTPQLQVKKASGPRIKTDNRRIHLKVIASVASVAHAIAELLDNRIGAPDSFSLSKSFQVRNHSVEFFHQTITEIPQPLSAPPLLNALGDLWKRGPNLPPRDEIATIMLSHISIKSCL